eukprot:gb/GECG01011760.1/.p1 GENE.gb/GECG01011760.1/~~gb/GECG01011760.1/.p1  ORF type:complete len:100 (+),score=10.13 gb/GECG01011760.1/:1-300(+)
MSLRNVLSDVTNKGGTDLPAERLRSKWQAMTITEQLVMSSSNFPIVGNSSSVVSSKRPGECSSENTWEPTDELRKDLDVENPNFYQRFQHHHQGRSVAQ